MSTICACLEWICGRHLKDDNEKIRQERYAQFRRGEGRIAEAHPRLFLYSVVECLWLTGTQNEELLLAVRDYKTGPHAQENRGVIFRFLNENRCWMGKHQRDLSLDMNGEEALIGSDHAFDAWLAALTAWAHNSTLTIRWDEARFPDGSKAFEEDDVVKVEGHILILSTKDAKTAE
jgi:hypothetical protein